MARPRQRTPELRDSIVAAGLEIFERDGPDALTTRSVAAAAGTSPAAIAELLDGKSGLLVAIVAEGFGRLDAQLALVEHGTEAEQDLVDLGLVYRRFSVDNDHLFDLMFSKPVHTFGTAVSDLDAIGNIYRAFTTRFGSLLNTTSGHRSAVDSATGFVALLHGLAIQERSGILGSTSASTGRRWTHGVQTFLAGAKSGR